MDKKGSVLMGKYEFGRLLGQGTFAKVYNAKSIETGHSVAIKVINKDKIVQVGLINQIKREISVMRLVRHPRILQLYEVMATKSKIYYVMEYAKGGELFNKVAKGRLKEDAARRYFQQLISAVDFCHSRGVYHRDLKPENLLLDEYEDLKLSDFGLSALAESKRQDGLLHTACGTPAYVAPEVINRKGYDGAKADVWSCGVILFVLLAGYLPFPDSNVTEMYKMISKAQYKCPNQFSREVRKLLSMILDPNPSTRTSISKIKENPWFKRGLMRPKPADAGTEPNVGGEEKEEQVRPANLNAFEILSLSPGFDLSRLFEPCLKKESRFTSVKPASFISTKLEEIAKHADLMVSKKDGGILKFVASKEGRKGILSIVAEILQVAPSFYLVEVKKCNGDTLEYQKIMEEGMRPGLGDVVWAWQDVGNQSQLDVQPQQQQHQRQLTVQRKSLGATWGQQEWSSTGKDQLI